MATKRDYYEVLGVPRNADKDQLKKAYRRLARQYHPDVSDEPSADEKFKEINEAYEVLADDQKRAAYDRYGHAATAPGGSGFQDFDFGNVAHIFEEFFGMGRGGRGPRRGADLRYNLTISFEEAVTGVEKDIEVSRAEICSHCRGVGAEPGTQPSRCSHCNGSGEVRRTQQSILGSFVNVTACPVCKGAGEVIFCLTLTDEGRRPPDSDWKAGPLPTFHLAAGWPVWLLLFRRGKTQQTLSA